MPTQRQSQPSCMIDRIAQALAEADGKDVAVDPGRYRRLALASLRPLMTPTQSMIDAAHEAVWFDAAWAINSRHDFQKAVKAMIAYVIAEDRAAKGS